MAKKTESEWLKEQGYLPRFMRDFHSQKDLFKWIWARIENKKSTSTQSTPTDPLAGMTWVSAHIFVVDYFLWFMARHGYTLQPVRKEWQMADWNRTLQEWKEEEAVAFRKFLETRAQNRLPDQDDEV